MSAFAALHHPQVHSAQAQAVRRRHLTLQAAASPSRSVRAAAGKPTPGHATLAARPFASGTADVRNLIAYTIAKPACTQCMQARDRACGAYPDLCDVQQAVAQLNP